MSTGAVHRVCVPEHTAHICDLGFFPLAQVLCTDPRSIPVPLPSPPSP